LRLKTNMACLSAIQEFFSNFPANLLKEALRSICSKDEGSKEKLLERTLLDIKELGTEETICHLSPKIVQCICDHFHLVAVEAVDEFAASNPYVLLEAYAKKETWPAFLSNVPLDLLQQVGDSLGIQSSTRNAASLRASLAEEAILTGMEAFLLLLTLPILKKICQNSSLKTTGKKQEIVDRIMKKMFEASESKEQPDGLDTTNAGETVAEDPSAAAKSDSVVKLVQRIELIDTENEDPATTTTTTGNVTPYNSPRKPVKKGTPLRMRQPFVNVDPNTLAVQ